MMMQEKHIELMVATNTRGIHPLKVFTLELNLIQFGVC